MFGQKTQTTWFFDSSVHLEAVSRLLYVVENHDSLAVLQGLDGSGRSRVLSRLREELSRTQVMTVSLNLAGIDEESALWQLGESLCPGAYRADRRHQILAQIRDELSGRAQCGLQTVVLLDDFHRASGDLQGFLRILLAFSVPCQGMLTVVVASNAALPAEFTSYTLLPIRLGTLDSLESADFVRSVIGQQGLQSMRVDESAVRAISSTSTGNTAQLSRLCELLRVVHEASPDLRITEETIYSLLSELSLDLNAHIVPAKAVMRAS